MTRFNLRSWRYFAGSMERGTKLNQGYSWYKKEEFMNRTRTVRYKNVKCKKKSEERILFEGCVFASSTFFVTFLDSFYS